MSRQEWYNIKKSYEIFLDIKKTPSLEKMPWLVDQIIESKYVDIFFPSMSLSCLHINLSGDWRDSGKLPKITVDPKWNWVTFHYCHFNKPKSDTFFDEFKVMVDQIYQVRETLFGLLERLEKCLIL
ncbi:hypothetical protein A6770_00480 [Nostoc minutum NIES-26]|uniref:Uncharacterized protein n=1 Tax=Nostoc minutum NIES-26 TaxID=1844469 RepID=A0A367QYZ1_9NOSO|nr:hypothetical protein A6770_00480 [Nostoc minutum NIES-26]